ncbi:MAG: type II CRISPR RNA-guided endonuclease Cas9 [bacterium]
MEKRRLGLDIGTNSIGWAILVKKDGAYDYLKVNDQNGNLIPAKGSYIFPKGTDANEKSKAATRRGYRATRKRYNRIRLRKIETLKVLTDYKLCPVILQKELNDWRYNKKYPCGNLDFIKWQRTGVKGENPESEKLKQPYYLRYLAATEPGLLEGEQGRYKLGRVFYHLAQRRGYLSISEEEQTDDYLELFKKAVKALINECNNIPEFYMSFPVLLEKYKSDKKVAAIGKKVNIWFKQESEFARFSELVNNELDKEENLGKVEAGIHELTKEIKGSGMPTLGAYLYSIYGKKDKNGAINKIRGRYIHRETHYLNEFNYICEKQNINKELKEKLYKAIFFQRPLKSQKGLVGSCPLEPKRKRIAKSHPLYEIFRMWESINRIKIKKGRENRLRFLTEDEKKQIINCFKVKNDFQFKKIAKVLSGNLSYRYTKDKDKPNADIEFNFPDEKTFTGSPTIYYLQRVLGNEYYEQLPFSKTDKIQKNQLSIEDIWHILFVDTYGDKKKQEVLKEFAINRLRFKDREQIEFFTKINLVKGYGNLSASVIKKILPFLEQGLDYSHAVFLANAKQVFGRNLSNDELEAVKHAIGTAMHVHKIEKNKQAVINNYIQKLKDSRTDENLGDNEFSIASHKKSLVESIHNWFSATELERLKHNEIHEFEDDCWSLFYEVAVNKLPKDIPFLSVKTIPEYIVDELKKKFPGEQIRQEKLFHPSAIETYKKADKYLGNPEIDAIKNPVFNKAMHQIKRLINKLIEEELIDENTEVNIEMAREINSASYRRALTIYQNDQQLIRNWARREIINCYTEINKKNSIPTDEQITKYILYAEQNGCCLYTGKPITPRLFLTEQIFDIEHTIPRSKLNDNSQINKTLALADFNRNYKKDVLPALLNISYAGVDIASESIQQIRNDKLRSYSISGNNVKWNVSLQALKKEYNKYRTAAKAAVSDPSAHEEMMTKLHYTGFKLNYLREKYVRFELEEIPKKFTNANLVDTRIITKYARAYLNSYFKKVNVVNGKITDVLRNLWGLEGEYEEKDRSNHIHHCIDATIVACVEKGTVNRISEAFHKYEKELFRKNLLIKARLKPPMDNFSSNMKNLHKEVFIYHHKQDRIKPLLKAISNNHQIKINLRGALNRSNPYGQIEVNGKNVFVQRIKISSLRERDIPNVIDETIKMRINHLLASNQKLKLQSLTEDGSLVLPEYKKANKEKPLKPVVLKKIRLKAYNQKQYPLKEIREMDKSKHRYKRDFYFQKEQYTNYEARIYGDLNPDNPDGRTKFSRREYYLINHFDIVKNQINIKSDYPFLFSIHEGDYFIIFNRHTDEINWEYNIELNHRLFRIKKFDEDRNIILQRNDIARKPKDVYTSEEKLLDKNGFLLKKVPNTFRAVPTKIDPLGRIDIKYCKAFIENCSG